MTAGSTFPKMSCNKPSRNRRQMAIRKTEITAELNSTWPAASPAPFLSLLPRNWAQIIHPPVETAVNRKMTSLLIESTQETPDTAALPMLETIRVSTVPMRAVSTCSMISGINSFRRSLLENIMMIRSVSSFLSVKQRFQRQFSQDHCGKYKNTARQFPGRKRLSQDHPARKSGENRLQAH